MKLINQILLLAVMNFQLAPAGADIVRDPIGVNVSAATSMSLTVRFADNNGARFTTSEALFCYRLLANGQCDPGAILGRLPPTRDRGSTSTAVSRITDVMTIPYSVIRSTVVRAKEVDFSDFYYVRRFTPQAGSDLGAGPGMDVFARVTCHLAGPATVPLSLTQVALYGRESDDDTDVKVIRLNNRNLPQGRVEARVNHTGTGILEGWWEVRRPGDASLQAIDLLPEAALAESERGLQQRFLRLQRFRVAASVEGTAIIPGPDYSDLPQSISGRHEILLRFDATIGRENRARLAVEGESQNLFSGGVAGFTIPILAYHTPVYSGKGLSPDPLAPRLVADVDKGGDQVWRLVWRPQVEAGLVLEFATVGMTGRHSLIAPAGAGVLEFPALWAKRMPQPNMSVTLLDSSSQPVGETEYVLTR